MSLVLMVTVFPPADSVPARALVSSWSDPVDLSAPGQDAERPQLVVDGSGDLTAVWFRVNGSVRVIQASSSSDGGSSWSSPVDLSTGVENAYNPQVVVDGSGGLTAVWEEGVMTDRIIKASSSSDGGSSWSDPVGLSASGQYAYNPQVVVDDSGDLTAVWEDMRGGLRIIQASSSSDGGSSWSDPVDLSAPGQDAERPQLVAGGSGEVTAVWNRYDGSNDIVQARTSSDGGSSWSSPVGLSASGQNASNPQVVVDGSGDVTAVWQRSDGSNTIIQAATRAGPLSSAVGRNDDDDDDTVAAPVTPAPAVTAPVRPRVAEAAPGPTAAVEGPVLRGGVVSAPPRVPTVLVGGVPTIVEESSPDPTTLSVVAGSLSLGVSVDEGSGGVSRSDDGVNRLSVKSGSAAVLQGAGLQPGARVQVFIPLSADDSRELASITVAADGTFSGELPVSTDPLAEPLPIGERLLQLVSVDADGNQVVLEMAVNVTQGDPAPALDRDAGDIPAVVPGATAVTSAGVVTEATTTVLPDQGLTVIEGDTWNMTVAAESEPGAPARLLLGETAGVSGAGFMAGTRADVWLFSEPALLGTVTIDENGEFSGEVGIDPDLIPTGEHTLQLQGVGTDGYVKAANMVVVVDQTVSQPAEPTTQSASGLLWWVLGLFLVVVLVVLFFLIARRRRHQNA